MEHQIKISHIAGILFLSVVMSLSSCKSTYNNNLYNPKEVAIVSQRLGIALKNTNKEDDKNMKLYAECSLWIGVPYKYGGTSKRGVDCSGLTMNVYKKVYKKKIARSTDDLAKETKKISKNNLYTGDLVFFSTSKKKGKITHVGIYFKDGYFIHASTSRGVVVSNLNEDYYRRNWIRGGRVR